MRPDIRVCIAGKAGPFDRGDLVEVVSEDRESLFVKRPTDDHSNPYMVQANRFRKATPEEIASLK